MFEQAMLASAPVGNRLLSTCAGVTGQVLLVGGLILAPLLFPQVLPQVQSLVSLVAPGPPPPPPGPSPTVRPRNTVAPTHVFRCTFCAPVRVPDKIEILNEDPPAYAETAGVIGGVPGGVPGGGGSDLIHQLMRAGDPPPPQPVRDVPRQPVQVVPKGPVSVDLIPGGRVKLAHPIHRVEPVYPALARQMRVAGTVELEGIITVDGHLRELHVKSGHALLVKAAMDAVRQWIYEPTTLNEQPVEVIAPITVTFRLN
jgi:protein TonB